MNLAKIFVEIVQTEAVTQFNEGRKGKNKVMTVLWRKYWRDSADVSTVTKMWLSTNKKKAEICKFRAKAKKVKKAIFCQ